jgi:hypothetical protein
MVKTWIFRSIDAPAIQKNVLSPEKTIRHSVAVDKSHTAPIINGQWLGIRQKGGCAVSNPTYFLQGCPTCGRRLQIRVEYLGRTVVCQHCRGDLTATDPASIRAGREDDGALLRRADQLLESIAERRLFMHSHDAEDAGDFL